MNRHVRAKIFLGFAVLVLWGIFTGPALAGIYKWTDENGKTHYTNDLSKVPREYRQSDEVQKLRGSVTKSSPSTGSPDKNGQKNGELSDAEKALAREAQSFLRKEAQFPKTHENAIATPTAWRQFLNAYNQLNQQRQDLLNKLQGSSAPALQSVASHLNSGVQAAQANPVGLRRMSIAMGLDRVKSETSGNTAMINKLQEALDGPKDKAPPPGPGGSKPNSKNPPPPGSKSPKPPQPSAPPQSATPGRY